MLKRGDVVNYTPPLKSFSYSKGLYAVLKQAGTYVHMAKILDDGNIQSFDNGKPMVLVTDNSKFKGIEFAHLTRDKKKVWSWGENTYEVPNHDSLKTIFH